MRRFTLIAAGVAFLASAAFAAPTVVLQPSRTSGVAPLAVHFDAADTTAPGIDAFSQLAFRWDFGDPNSGSFSVTGRSKNTAAGPVAAHVYETPGSYSVTLRVSDPSGVVTTRTATISVSGPNTVYSGTSTICVSASGAFAGCPSGAQQVVSSSFNDAVSAATTGHRVLLHRGETYAAAQMGINRGGPVTIGAFGTGAAPLIQSSATTLIKLGGVPSSFDDVRIMDLSFDGGGVAGSRTFDGQGTVTNLLVLRVSITNFDNAAFIAHQAASRAGRMNEGLFFADCTFNNFTGPGDGFYLSAHKLVMLGNRGDYRNAPDHLLRIPYIERGVISHNRFEGAGVGRHVVKIHSLGEADVLSFPERRSREFVFSDNVVVGSSNGWDATVGPQNTTEDERVERALFERNLFRLAPSGSVSLFLWGSQLTVRNNVFDSSAASGGAGVIFGRRGIEPNPVGDTAVNNTCYSTTGTVSCANFQAGSGHFSANNLAVGAAGSSASGLAGGSTNLVVSSPPWLAANPQVMSDYKTDAPRAAALIDKGTTLAEVTIDPLGVIAPFDGNNDGVASWDVGAFEVGTPSGGGSPPPASAPAAPVLLAP